MTAPAASSRAGSGGLAQALGACLFWGLMPVYFKLLDSVAPVEIVAHRVIWSVPLLIAILWFRRSLRDVVAAFRSPRLLLMLVASSLLIAANWLIYVWAVHNDHILAASLGYFISPLIAVLLGRLVLKERLGLLQVAAVALAAVGVSVLAAQALDTLWISLVLAGSWASYALVRKVAVVGPVVGLTVETALLAPLGVAFLLFGLGMFGAEPGALHMGDDIGIDALLVGGAVVTAVPLMLFAAAVKKMSLSAIGLLQYLAPTIQFAIGAFVYREPLTASHIICFAVIWVALALFSTDSIRAERARRAAPVHP